MHIELAGRPVEICARRYELRAGDGFVVPVLLLDTYLPSNSFSHVTNGVRSATWT